MGRIFAALILELLTNRISVFYYSFIAFGSQVNIVVAASYAV